MHCRQQTTAALRCLQLIQHRFSQRALRLPSSIRTGTSVISVRCSHSEKSTPIPPVHHHSQVGTAQQLYITDPITPGSPFFLPNGTKIFNKLLSFLRAQYFLYGFEEVVTPLIYKRRLWEQSGHWQNFKDDMFEVRGRGATGVDSTSIKLEIGQEEEYGLKPMNCPGHCLLFKSTVRSYRDLPIRLADFSSLHRNENAGALSGLTRVRRFHQDDAHIFCRPSQIASEISLQLEFIRTVYKVFNLPSFSLVLSTRPANFMGESELWDRAESSLKSALEASGQEWTLNEGDGAFYGPKIDIILKDGTGRSHQTATIQLDFQLPLRFGLEYIAPDTERERQGLESSAAEAPSKSGPVTPVIIHRAILGSVERFMALLMEHHEGRWPFWINPRQAIVLTVNSTQQVINYARQVQREISGVSAAHEHSRPLPLSQRVYSVDFDNSTRSIGKKVLEARSKRYNFVIVIGDRNVESKTISVKQIYQKPGGSSEWGEDKGEMTAEQVYSMFRELEDSYH